LTGAFTASLRWAMVSAMLWFCLHIPFAQAQTAQRPAAARPATPPVPALPEPEAIPQPYEPDLLRLAEIIGAMAFLRGLCEGQDRAIWPERMRNLMEAEGRSGPIKERLAGAYNRGFRSYALVHQQCSDVAKEAAARLALDGDVLSRKLANRFGG
jgi:uncharacterized protein (TIGR02301 family)